MLRALGSELFALDRVASSRVQFNVGDFIFIN